MSEAEKVEGTLSPKRLESEVVLEATVQPELASALSPFKEGGRQGWLSVVGAFLILFATSGQLSAFGSFQLWYSGHQLVSYPPSAISWIGSLQYWVFFFSGGIAGRLFDAYGPTVLIALGTIISTFGLMMTSIATRYYQFILAQGFVFGVGTGLVFYPAVSAVTTHFRKWRATTIGIIVSGASVGGVAFSSMLQHLFNETTFGWAVRTCGFITLGCGIFATLTVTSRLPHKKPGPWVDLPSFRDVRFMIFNLGAGFACFGIFVPYFYIVNFAQTRGIDDARAFALLSIMNAGSIPGRILPGIVADLLGRFNLYFIFSFSTGFFTLVLWLTQTQFQGLVAYAVIYGFFSGALISLTSPCIAQISKIEQIGIRIGMSYSILAFPALVGSPIAGALLTRAHGNFTPLMVWAGVTVLFGSGLLLAARLLLDRNILHKV